mmetsp:Transcript_42750/g.101876  ORF Transcript_42750/g.101876 Transcript_42750/m.101876 type:complete len:206 (+) Transcript_42750:221-838(+)
MHAKHGVVGFHHSSRHLRTRPNCEGNLALLTIVHGQAFQHQASQARSCATTDSVVHTEALQAGAIIGQFADSIKDQVDDLLANGVVSPCEVVRRVFLSGNELLRVEQLAIRACTHLIHDRRFQVHHHAAWHVLARPGLAEKGIKCIVSSTNRLVGWHLAVRLDAVLEAEELPASIADLHAALTDVDADCLTHGLVRKRVGSHLAM